MCGTVHHDRRGMYRDIGTKCLKMKRGVGYSDKSQRKLVFFSPGDGRVQLGPPTVGTHFSRLLTHTWTAVGLLLFQIKARERINGDNVRLILAYVSLVTEAWRLPWLHTSNVPH